MATSNSWSYTETCSQVINDAYMFLGKLGVGDTLTPAEYNLGLRTLNRMIKSIIKKNDRSSGMKLWKRTPRLHVAVYNYGSI